MKIVAQKIDMIASFVADEKPMPIRFRIKEDDSFEVVRVDKIVSVEETKRAGTVAFIYRCRSKMNDVERLYELRYKVIDCKWDLYKI